MSSISSLGGSSGLLGSSSLVTPTLNNNGTITLSGLASGLNTSQIIQDLVAVQQAQITNLQNSQNQIQTEQSAYQQLQADLAAVQSDVATLAQTQGGAFAAHNVASSNPNVVTAAADSTAVPGEYSLTVNTLATANQIASQGFSSANAAITQGTIQIRTGSGPAQTITINATNDTLQGLAQAINQANAGVTASIINDGSGSANQPYRLVLASNQTGVDHAIQLSNGLAADNSGATLPVFNATYIGSAQTGAGYTGTAAPTANSGAGTYTGAADDTYTFTAVNSGTVGTDSIQLSYTNTSGTSKGTINLGSGDAGVFKNVAQGLQIQLSAGTLIAGQSFSVKVYTPTVQQAANASVTLGSGSGALTVQSDANQVDNVIPGVTLNLVSAAPSSPVSLTVSSDTSQATTAIQNFVTDYNNLIDFLQQQTSYNTSTSQAGVLLGNGQVAQIQNELTNIVNSQFPGLNPSLDSLESLGISFDLSGKLQINQGTLNNVLDGGVPGVSLDDVQRLFGLTGSSTSPEVQFIAGTDKTAASGATPYQVSITQAAKQASVVASNPLAASTSIDTTNNTFALTVDGRTSGTITLKPGTYTQAALAQEVQIEINAQSNLANDQVTVTANNNQLTITTNSYGSSSQLAIGSGTALSPLGFAGTETGKGKDVAGSFVVNGVKEGATGNGQLLTGNSGNASTSGLEIKVTLTDAQVGSGAQVPLTVTRGVAASLQANLDNWLDPVNGLFATANTGFQTTQTNLQNQINEINTSIQSKEQSLIQQFSAMEQAVSQLQNISNFLYMQFNNSTTQQGAPKIL